MKTTMVHLSKGGVGKTTISVLYAWYQRRLGKRVLFVDFDMQCNSSKILTQVDPAEYPEFHARQVGTILDFADSSFPEKLSTIDAGPFDILISVEDIKFGQAEGEAIMGAVVALARSAAYDICIFDTSPVLDEQVVGLMQTVDNLVIPMRPDDFSFDQVGVVLQLKTIADQNRAVPLNIAGVVLNGMMSKPTMLDIEKLVRAGYGDIALDAVIDSSEPVRIAMDKAKPLFAQNSSWARSKRKDIEAAFDEIDRRSL